MKDIMIRKSMETVLGEKEAALAIEAVRTGKVTMEALQTREELWT